MPCAFDQADMGNFRCDQRRGDRADTRVAESATLRTTRATAAVITSFQADDTRHVHSELLQWDGGSVTVLL